MSHNNITGDKLRTKTNTDQSAYDKGWDLIYSKKTVVGDHEALLRYVPGTADEIPDNTHPENHNE